MQIQYLNREWLNVGNSDWPRVEVILLDSDLMSCVAKVKVMQWL